MTWPTQEKLKFSSIFSSSVERTSADEKLIDEVKWSQIPHTGRIGAVVYIIF